MFTVTKTTQGAYTAYVLADTGHGNILQESCC